MKKGNVTGQMASSMEEAKELLEELHAFPRQKANNLPILISFLKNSELPVRSFIIELSESQCSWVSSPRSVFRLMHRCFWFSPGR